MISTQISGARRYGLFREVRHERCRCPDDVRDADSYAVKMEHSLITTHRATGASAPADRHLQATVTVARRAHFQLAPGVYLDLVGQIMQAGSRNASSSVRVGLRV